MHKKIFFDKPRLQNVLDRLGGRILVYVGITFLVGWIGLSVLVSQVHEHLTMNQNERAVLLVTRSVAGGLKTIMLAGDAEIAEDFSRNLQSVSGVVDFRILRNDGSEAFRSNDTIRIVNGRLGGDRFPLRKKESKNQVLARDSKVLQEALARGREVPVYEQDAAGNLLLTYVAPIPSLDECRACHGTGEPSRGVIKLTMSLAKAQEEVRHARWWIFGLGIGSALLVMVVVHGAVRRLAVTPLERMAGALGDANALERFLPVEGCAEFRQVATAFNQMTTQLNAAWQGLQGERDKLNTILLGVREGIVATDRDERVVMVNPAAERLLGKSAAQIQEEGFLYLFDDPEHMRALREDDHHELPGLVCFNHRMLQTHAATIVDVSGTAIGSAALIRDVSREKALEEELRQLSNTDALTGLFNRRRFDEAFLDEYDRARRYELVVGLLLLDVDHFKRFNDEHGHDQGDRVLQSIADLMRVHFRSVDYPCRFGGEEFCVIMPSTGAAGVLRSSARLRESVESLSVDGLRVTVSIGVAIFPEVGRSGPAALLKAADLALYAAKRQGRNQVCHFTPEMEAALSEAAPS